MECGPAVVLSELDLQVLKSVCLDRQGLTCCVLNPTERRVLTVYLQGEQMFPSNRAKFRSNLQQLKGHAFKRLCRTQAVAVRALYCCFLSQFSHVHICALEIIVLS